MWWIDAERWLTAHRINEIAILYAQHLDERMTDELKENAGRRPGIALALIYGRPPLATAAVPSERAERALSRKCRRRLPHGRIPPGGGSLRWLQAGGR